jgi:hypothetical protein
MRRLVKEWLFKRASRNELLGLFVAARLGPLVVLGYKSGPR